VTGRAFLVAAAQTWSALPLSVGTSLTYLAFFCKLKTLLIKASLEDWT